MNPSNLPPQGRYSDDRLQQMVLDELERQGVRAEKFYFTSDDWMVSYDGQTPAWNSVFAIAAYHKDGQAQYAECGVSQRFDTVTSQWGDPAATVKVDLPVSEEAFQAAPSALGAISGSAISGSAAAGATVGDDEGVPGAASGGSFGERADGQAQQPVPDSSQTMMADAIPGLPGQAPGDTPAAGAGEAGAAGAGAGGAGVAAAGVAAGVVGGAATGAALAGSDDDEPQSDFPSGEEWSAADRADGQPRVEPGPGHEWHHTDSGPEPEREPVPSGDEWSSAEPAVQSAGETDPEADLRQAGDLGVDESALAGAAAGGVVGAAGGAAVASAGEDAEGAASGATGASAGRAEAPSYESAGAEAEAREHPDGGHLAHVAGYALRVMQDGTAELQVPLGGQVTLRWAGQDSE